MASELIESKLKNLPDLPGCYIMRNANDDIIYIGKAKNLKNRVRSYFRGAHDTKTEKLVSEIHHFEYIVTKTNKESLLLEINLIKKYQPHYNIKLKQGTMYPYLKITSEKDPQLVISHKVEKDGGIYFGPYPNVTAATGTQQLIQKIYPLRKCGKNETRACFYYHLGQCIGCCDHEVSKEEVIEIIEKDSVIRAIPYGAITKEEYGRELSDMEDIADKVFAFTDDGRGVQNANVMYEAMLMGSKLNKAIVAHCEDNSLIRGGAMHEGKRSAELGIKGIPSICESTQIARDILLAEAANCHYHVCHISAKESVRAVREGKKNGIKVTCEVTPHHLLSCDEDIKEDNGMWKMNPPLRGREDRNALISGILDGTIDIIATDHAPHTMEEKTRGIAKSSFGIVGSETAFAQLYTKFVKTDIFSLEMLVKLMSENVAKIFNLPYGKLEENSFADIVVIDLEKEITINPEEFLSKGRNTPYTNEKVNGIPVLTISKGKIAYIDKEEINL